MKIAKSTFKITRWDEVTVETREDCPKMAQVSAIKDYEGDLEGESFVEYVMLHQSNGYSTFVGLEQFVGTLIDRTGSFVIKHEGSFDTGVVSIQMNIVEDSGTQELVKISGEGFFKSAQADFYTLELSYHL